jgi:hypothetical protein
MAGAKPTMGGSPRSRHTLAVISSRPAAPTTASMTHPSKSEARSAITGHRFSLLFVFLLTTLILYPFAEATHFGYYAFRVIGSFSILVSVYAAKIRRGPLVLAFALAIPALVEHIVLPKADISALPLLNTSLSFVFDIIIIVLIFRHVFASERPNTETIFGALCVYILVGFTFASVYRLISALQPNAFYLDPRVNLHAVPDRFDFIYYSFCTMTSLGATGITPVTGQVRAISILEAILGVLYLAVLIARLMGAYRPPSPQ